MSAQRSGLSRHAEPSVSSSSAIAAGITHVTALSVPRSDADRVSATWCSARHAGGDRAVEDSRCSGRARGYSTVIPLYGARSLQRARIPGLFQYGVVDSPVATGLLDDGTCPRVAPAETAGNTERCSRRRTPMSRFETRLDDGARADGASAPGTPPVGEHADRTEPPVETVAGRTDGTPTRPRLDADGARP
jgi:hypothetical protein